MSLVRRVADIHPVPIAVVLFLWDEGHISDGEAVALIGFIGTFPVAAMAREVADLDEYEVDLTTS